MKHEIRSFEEKGMLYLIYYHNDKIIDRLIITRNNLLGIASQPGVQYVVDNKNKVKFKMRPKLFKLLQDRLGYNGEYKPLHMSNEVIETLFDRFNIDYKYKPILKKPLSLEAIAWFINISKDTIVLDKHINNNLTLEDTFAIWKKEDGHRFYNLLLDYEWGLSRGLDKFVNKFHKEDLTPAQKIEFNYLIYSYSENYYLLDEDYIYNLNLYIAKNLVGHRFGLLAEDIRIHSYNLDAIKKTINRIYDIDKEFNINFTKINQAYNMFWEIFNSIDTNNEFTDIQIISLFNHLNRRV